MLRILAHVRNTNNLGARGFYPVQADVQRFSAVDYKNGASLLRENCAFTVLMHTRTGSGVSHQGLAILSLAYDAGTSEGEQPLRKSRPVGATPFSQIWEKGAGG